MLTRDPHGKKFGYDRWQMILMGYTRDGQWQETQNKKKNIFI